MLAKDETDYSFTGKLAVMKDRDSLTDAIIVLIVLGVVVLIAGAIFWIGIQIGGKAGFLFTMLGWFVGIPILVVVANKIKEWGDRDFKL